MTTFHRAALLIAVAAVALAALWWKCRRDPIINFLPQDRRAEWVTFPIVVDASSHKIASIDATFRRQFELRARPKAAHLQLRAAKRVQLRINGEPVKIEADGNWKTIATGEVTGLLRSGSNTIAAQVFNDDGPPALWLLLSSDELQFSSDGNWEASLAGSAWRPVSLASQRLHPRPGNPLAGGEKINQVLPGIWQTWAILLASAILILTVANWWLGRPPSQPGGAVPTALSCRHAIILLTTLTILWGILFWNNAPRLPFHSGYDAPAHLEYIKYLQDRRALPLPNEGFEMFQPPLFYTLSAAVLSLCRLTVADPASVVVLRTLTMSAGLAHFMIVFFCLRLLFPTRGGAQIFGLLLAAFLPMQLYLSHYVTNETLAAALVSGTIYLALRILGKKNISVWASIGLGVCSGAAMLTKATSLLLIPPLIGALIMKMARDQVKLSRAIICIGTTVIAILAACGWYYFWIWRHFRTPIVGNWERAFGWWQDPGFHIAAHYFRFGQALVEPLFAGYNGFWDGIYSTLWGDGLGGGLSDMLSRTPWNYPLMIGGYLLALFPTFLIVLGLAIAIYRFVRQPTPEWFLLLGLSAAVIVGIAFLTLRVASYAQVKAFYGLSALVPLSAFAADGWQKLERAPRLLQHGFGLIVVFWALNSFVSVWIRSSAVQHIYVGRRWVAEHRLDSAASEAAQAVRMEPSNATAQCFLAAALDDLRQTDEAIAGANRGIRLDPANGQCQIQVAINFVRQGKIEQAMAAARRLIDLEPENALAYNVLFACTQQLQRQSEAIAVGRDALALLPFDADLHYRLGLAAGEVGNFEIAAAQFAYASLLRSTRSDVEAKLHLAVVFAAKSPTAGEQLARMASSAPESATLLNELAWILATHPDAAVRNGSEALRLSEQACVLTNRSRSPFLLTLAAANAESGNFADARAVAEQALSLANSNRDAVAAARAQNLLTSFQGGQAYREEPRP